MTNFELQTSNFEQLWPPASSLLLSEPVSRDPEPFHTRAFRFSCAIVRLYTRLTNSPGVPPYLARQLLGAGTSIGANLEEARGAQTRRDVTAKFSIALKETRETAYWLRLLVATTLVPPELIRPVLAEANELIAILTTARRKLSEKGGSD